MYDKGLTHFFYDAKEIKINKTQSMTAIQRLV